MIEVTIKYTFVLYSKCSLFRSSYWLALTTVNLLTEQSQYFRYTLVTQINFSLLSQRCAFNND